MLAGAAETLQAGYNNDSQMPVLSSQLRRFALCAVTLLLLAAVSPAQKQIGPDEVNLRGAPYTPLPPTAIIRAQVELVEVPVVVRDGKGAAIPGLAREDFEVFDAGKKKEITAFSVETLTRTAPAANDGPATSAPHEASPPPTAPVPSEAPKRFIALVLDDLNTDASNLSRARTAAEKFVEKSLAPGDLVGVFTTALSGTVTFSADPEKLRQAIEAVVPHSRYADELHECAPIRAYEAYVISNHLDPELTHEKAGELAACLHITDPKMALRAAEMKAEGIWQHAKLNTENTLRSLDSIMATMSKMPGQRIVMLTSGGFVSNEEELWLEQLITTALHSGVIVSAMDLRGLYTIIPSGDASTPLEVAQARQRHPAEVRIEEQTENTQADALAMLASGTGGQFFHNNNDLAAGFRRMGAVPEVLYVLGFSAAGATHDGKFHPLKVRVSGHHGSVQARMGYMDTAPVSDPPPDLEPRRNRDRILMSADKPADIPVRVTTEPGSDTGPKVAVKVWIDVSRLTFEQKEDRQKQKMTMTAALLDPAGNFVIGRQVEAELSLKDDTFKALSATGLTIALSLHAAPGTYNLRVLLQEAGSGKMTAVSGPVQLQ
jgi:VWFA-related protein